MKQHRSLSHSIPDDHASSVTRTSVSDVCSYIAFAGLGANEGVGDEQCAEANSLGAITLRAHQQRALQRVRMSISQHHGALLADAVGLGKTYVALALARDYDHVNVLAPATLLPMWRDAIARTASVGITLHSLQTLSRRALASPASPRATLTIIDEAHHLRTHNTVRYKHAQQFVSGHDVLLLTATPVHNRIRELHNLLSLFLGTRADVLDRDMLAKCVVRQTATDESQPLVPSVREHIPHVIPDNRAVLETILQLPPPLPVNDGAAASALVRLGLLRAWCSSDAALTDRIRRRQLRGEALLHSLVHGRYPTHRELESWIVGSDSLQLGFAELLVATASGDTSALLKTLTAHLDGLQHLLQLHTRTCTADPARASVLRALLRDESNPPVVAFSQFASTVRALHRALSDLAGVASLTSEGGRIASGSIARHELIANFAPRASGRPPPAASQRVRLLISTDLLAEGVNLQDAGALVHLDLPWTHALRQQRVGRVARMGSRFRFVDVHTLAPPMGAEHALQLVATLERKAGIHRAWIGSEATPYGPGHGPSIGRPTPTRLYSPVTSAPDDATALDRLWQSWRPKPAPIFNCKTCVASVAAEHAGWIALVEQQSVQCVVAHVQPPFAQDVVPGTGGSPGTSVSILLGAVRAASARAASRTDVRCTHGECPQVACTDIACMRVDANPVEPNHVERNSVQHAFDQLAQWMHTQHLHDLAGSPTRTLAPSQRRALSTLAARLRTLSAVRRTALATRASELEERILAARGTESERKLDEWTQSAAGMPVDSWMRQFPPIPADVKRASPNTAPPGSRVIALLILQPHAAESG